MAHGIRQLMSRTGFIALCAVQPFMLEAQFFYINREPFYNAERANLAIAYHIWENSQAQAEEVTEEHVQAIALLDDIPKLPFRAKEIAEMPLVATNKNGVEYSFVVEFIPWATRISRPDTPEGFVVDAERAALTKRLGYLIRGWVLSVNTTRANFITPKKDSKVPVAKQEVRMGNLELYVFDIDKKVVAKKDTKPISYLIPVWEQPPPIWPQPLDPLHPACVTPGYFDGIPFTETSRYLVVMRYEYEKGKHIGNSVLF